MLAPQVDSLAQTRCHAEPLPGDAKALPGSWEATEVKCLMVTCRRGLRAPSYTA